MKQAIENAVKWVLISSADPTKVSLTVRGALLNLVPIIMAVAGLAHVNLGDGSALTALFDNAAQFLQDALTVVATSMMVWGAFRKLLSGVPAVSI